jgi:hypothetical protein
MSPKARTWVKAEKRRRMVVRAEAEKCMFVLVDSGPVLRVLQ